jgi:hypothetical protein
MFICKIDGELKIGSNEKGETFVWWPEGNRWLSMEEFKKCEIEPGTKFVLYIQNEIKNKVKKSVLSNNSSSSTFNNNINYNISPTALTLKSFNKLELQNEIRQYEHETTPINDSDPYSVSDIFTGIAATTALLMSAAQQIRQKKKEAESSLCCNNNKIEISKFDAKLQKLETELKAQSEKDNKGMIAEILETRKEIRDIKEEFQHGKEDIQKIIEIMSINKPK